MMFETVFSIWSFAAVVAFVAMVLGLIITGKWNLKWGGFCTIFIWIPQLVMAAIKWIWLQ